MEDLDKVEKKKIIELYRAKFEFNHWYEKYPEFLVAKYRSDRDPYLLTRFISQDVFAMSTPAIGRLFLDLINENLPPASGRPKSTVIVRSLAVRLVLFYLGQNIKKTKAFAAAGKVLSKSFDTIKGYFEDWVEGKETLDWAVERPKNIPNPKLFWKEPAKYLQMNEAFMHGKAMSDDELANKMKNEDESISWFRDCLRGWYEEVNFRSEVDIDSEDPWERVEAQAMLCFKRKEWDWEGF